MTISCEPIGVVRTPYLSNAPSQPKGSEEIRCRVILDPPYRVGLAGLETFRYVILLTWLDRSSSPASMDVVPPWSHGKAVGLFASRAPSRPNPIGMSIVKILEVLPDGLVTTSLDLFDETPLLDIKPYIALLDSKEDAGNGWLEEGGSEHLIQHLKGIPHEHG